MTDFMFLPVVLGNPSTSTLPTWMGTIDLSSITDTATGVAALVVPVIVAVVGITIGVKLLKGYLKKIGG